MQTQTQTLTDTKVRVAPNAPAADASSPYTAAGASSLYDTALAAVERLSDEKKVRLLANMLEGDISMSEELAEFLFQNGGDELAKALVGFLDFEPECGRVSDEEFDYYTGACGGRYFA